MKLKNGNLHPETHIMVVDLKKQIIIIEFKWKNMQRIRIPLRGKTKRIKDMYEAGKMLSKIKNLNELISHTKDFEIIKTIITR